jgi:hypothetical protein
MLVTFRITVEIPDIEDRNDDEEELAKELSDKLDKMQSNMEEIVAKSDIEEITLDEAEWYED